MATRNGFRVWDEELERELFTPEEIAANNVMVAILCELIKARNERGLSNKKLAKLCGVKKSVISRMERGSKSPRIDTIMKILAPLGKTLAVVPLVE